MSQGKSKIDLALVKELIDMHQKYAHPPTAIIKEVSWQQGFDTGCFAIVGLSEDIIRQESKEDVERVIQSFPTVDSITPLTEDQHPKNLDLLEEELGEKGGKYDELVWLARHDGHPAGRKEAARIKKEYRREFKLLCCKKVGDWHHGFNSGCLATCRLLLAILDASDQAKETQSAMAQITDLDEDQASWTTDDEIEQAKTEFPFLDT